MLYPRTSFGKNFQFPSHQFLNKFQFPNPKHDDDDRIWKLEL